MCGKCPILLQRFCNSFGLCTVSRIRLQVDIGVFLWLRYPSLSAPSPWCSKKCCLFQAREREFRLGESPRSCAPSWLTRYRFAFRHVSDGLGCLDKLMNQILAYAMILDATFMHCWLGTGAFQNQKSARC